MLHGDTRDAVRGPIDLVQLRCLRVTVCLPDAGAAPFREQF